jgi:hypothetical protein
MDAIIMIIFFIFWFVTTGFIALNPSAAWEIFGRRQARSYPSKQYFRLLRLFGLIGFILPILWLLSQFLGW